MTTANMMKVTSMSAENFVSVLGDELSDWALQADDIVMLAENRTLRVVRSGSVVRSMLGTASALAAFEGGAT